MRGKLATRGARILRPYDCDMTQISTIWEVLSTNGRWGMSIVGPHGISLPAQGSLRHVGTVEGVSTYLFTPGEVGTWVQAHTESAKIHGGATKVQGMDLQSGRQASIVLLGPEAIVEWFGYKNRSSRVVAYADGKEQPIQQAYDMALEAADKKRSDLFTPEGRQNRGSSAACAFWDGYNGKRSLFAGRGTLTAAQYAAGKTYRKKTDAAVKRPVGKPASADPARPRTVRLDDARWAKYQTLGRGWLEAAIDAA